LAAVHGGDSKLKILLRPTVTFLNVYPFCIFDVSTKIKNVAYIWRLFSFLQMASNQPQWRPAILTQSVPTDQN